MASQLVPRDGVDDLSSAMVGAGGWSFDEAEDAGKDGGSKSASLRSVGCTPRRSALVSNRRAALCAVPSSSASTTSTPRLVSANSEAVLGNVLAGIDVLLVISTKLGGRPQPFDPQDRKQLSQSIEESLRLLGREVIDVLFVHELDRPLQYNWWSDPEEVYGPVVDVLDDFKRRGIVRFTGLGGTTMTEMAHLVRSDRRAPSGADATCQ